MENSTGNGVVPCPLKSPTLMYNDMIMRIDDSLSEDHKTKLWFCLRDFLPDRLRNDQFVQWVSELERRDKLSLKNLKCLQDALGAARMEALAKEVARLQVRLKIIAFFQDHLRKNGLPSLDDELTKPQSHEAVLPEAFVKDCRAICGSSELENVFILAAVFLHKNCKLNGDSVRNIALKVLFISNHLDELYGAQVLENGGNISIPSSSNTSSVTSSQP